MLQRSQLKLLTRQPECSSTSRSPDTYADTGHGVYPMNMVVHDEIITGDDMKLTKYAILSMLGNSTGYRKCENDILIGPLVYLSPNVPFLYASADVVSAADLLILATVSVLKMDKRKNGPLSWTESSLLAAQQFE
nr:hypothetical protein Iba_chr02bCG6790 [Ipomoea batatas]